MSTLRSSLFPSILFPILLLCSFGVVAQETLQPRIALVLGGGGARGAAHIGVLEVLEREHIPVACVVGTSMGGLAAGSYAAGLSPSEMRAKLDKADWTDIFLDLADYSQLSYRKKRVTTRYLPGTEIGVTKHGAQIQPGVIGGEKIKLFFNHLVAADLGERNIESLPLPTAIVATDIGTGEEVVFKSGSLTQAMRASMSVPGLMSPVEYAGHKLVDGGLVDNLPVKVARELCNPDVVIAVNVGSPLMPADEVVSLLSVSGQMIGILTKQNVERSIASLTTKDIYIEPALGEFSATDFKNYSEAADIGRAAAEAKLTQLRQYAIDAKAYSVWQHSKMDTRKQAVQIDEVAISPLKRIHPDYIAQHLRQKTPAELDREQLEQDLIRVYGDGYYENVDYNINRDNGKNILQVSAVERNWSSDYFIFGFDIDSEYRQGSSFDLRAAYRSTWLNSYGGEFFATVDIGNSPSAEVEFYQPLNYRQTYFIQPAYYHKREIISIFSNEEKVAEYQFNRAYSELALGKNLDIYGQAKLGWREYDIKSTADITEVDLGNYHEKYGGGIFDLVIDRRNRLHFPSRGWYGHFSYFDSNTKEYSKLTSELSFAYPLADFVVAGRTTYVSSVHGNLPPYDAAYLGGFLNLSAYASNQIIADKAFYAHLRGERIIGRMPLGLNGDLRLGLGIEVAKINNGYTFNQNDDKLNSAVIYLGGETPLGPAYLGCGFSTDGKINFYLQVGAN